MVEDGGKTRDLKGTAGTPSTQKILVQSVPVIEGVSRQPIHSPCCGTHTVGELLSGFLRVRDGTHPCAFDPEGSMHTEVSGLRACRPESVRLYGSRDPWLSDTLGTETGSLRVPRPLYTKECCCETTFPGTQEPVSVTTATTSTPTHPLSVEDRFVQVFPGDEKELPRSPGFDIAPEPSSSVSTAPRERTRPPVVDPPMPLSCARLSVVFRFKRGLSELEGSRRRV